MTLQQVLDFLNGRKSGTYFSIEMKTTKKARAEFKAQNLLLEKITYVKNRIGQKYVSTSETLNGGANQYEVVIPYRLKKKQDKNGEWQYYLEVHTSGSTPQVKYLVNGVEVEKEVFNNYLTPSEANKKMESSNAYYIVNISNILRLV